MVSVVIPARDAETTLVRQLDALAVQTYAGAWELVVVDSASSDGTAAAAERWSGTQPLRVEKLDRPGMNHARNAGARLASGELIVYCDADDEVAPGWLAAMTAAAVDADLVGGELEHVTLNEPTAIAARAWPYGNGRLAVALGFRPFAYGATFAIWRDVFDALDGWDENFRHFTDVQMSWRAQGAGYRLAFAPDAIVHYRLRSSPGAVFHQHFRYARDEPRLYREFRQLGMPRTSAWRAVRTWVILVLQVVRLRDPERRNRWLRLAGGSVGRIVGSFRQRVVFL
jgi:glycosyltransferase involved in cell wall biosynthesis